MDKKAKKLVTIAGATAAVTSFGVASNVHADNVATDIQSGIHQDINNPLQQLLKHLQKQLIKHNKQLLQVKK